MSLARPGIGDLMDRVSILSRKLVERPERGDFAAEIAELAQVRVTLDSELKHGDNWMIPGMRLAALNAAIWQREDRLRELGNDAANTRPEDVAEVAFAIQRLNDKRAALIAELNGTPSEKVYK